MKLNIFFMEIDLELPSGQEDKIDRTLDANFIDGTNGMHAGEENVNFPRTSKHVNEKIGSNLVEKIIESGEVVDMNTVGVDIHSGIISYEPQKGLEFETKEAAYSFYREYARSVGFGITIKASRRSKKSGKFIDVKIACSRFGGKQESSTTINPRSCPKTDCKASMHMKRRQDGKWYIYSVVKEHNHEFCPDDFYSALRGRNKQSAACQKKGLQLAFDEGDVQVLLEHFMLMQSEDPNCWYAIDFDQEKRMRNVFWVDAKGRHDYEYFCDVVLIDMYYIRNKYKIPFASIVGVNQHCHFMLLGCALIGDESASTFVWLMRTWLRAMGGPSPGVIITDEYKFLREAVGEVFPEAQHFFCLWHVLEKMHENLSCMNQFENFSSKFNKCIYRSWTGEEFEKRWWKIIEHFDLKENQWMQSLYEDRRRWVPTYMRNTSLAGLCMTERSESISSFFDKYIHRESTLNEFIDQYKACLRDMFEEEAKADFETQHKQPTLTSLSPFEKQMSTVYTHAIFKKFQKEVLGIVACNLKKECENEANVIFRVNDVEEQQYFMVGWNEAELEVYCLCHSFEYKGFLCRHALIVLQISGVSNIPPHYILKRWMKHAKIRETMSGISRKLQYRVQRFNDLCKLALKLGEEGSLSQETYHTACYALDEALKHGLGVNNFVRNTYSGQPVLNIEEENEGSNLSKTSKKKKIQRKRKVQSEAEVTLTCIRMQEGSQLTEQLNTRTHPVNNYYVPQQDMQRMELGSTAMLQNYYGAQQTVQGGDGCYGNQEGMQELVCEGQLNLVPTRVGHYGPQQSLHGLLQGQLAFSTPTLHGCFDLQGSLHDMGQSANIESKHLHDKHLSQ